MKKYLIIASLIVGLAACTTKQPANDETPREDIAVGDTVYLKSGVKYLFTKKAEEGEFVTSDKLVTTHINLYVGDERVWTTYEPLEPFAFVLDQQPMIDGFNEVIVLMQEGDRITAIIPPHLGYKDRPNGPIPANSTLNFDIEVLSVD